MTDVAAASFAAMAATNSQKSPPSTSATTADKAGQVAKDFTSFVVSQFMQEMYANMKADKTFGGGAGEETFRSLLVDEYGKLSAQSGGFGLTETVKQNILKLQEIQK